jgi:replicative DNA helicase
MHDIAEQFDRLPPRNIDAERCMLASMMLDKDILRDVLQIASADDCFLEDHIIIFRAIAGLRALEKPIDAVILREELVRIGELESIGGFQYLAVILSTVPSPANGAHYARIVAEKSALRRLIRQSYEQLKRAMAPDAESAEINQWAISELATQHATGRTPAAVVLEDALHEVYEEATGDGVPMISLPFSFLNDWTGGGLASGEYVIIAGWPSHGKSAFCKQIAAHFAKHGHPGGIVSLEESRKKIARNILSSTTGVNNKDIRKGRITGNQADKLVDGIAALAGQKLYIHDTAQTLVQVVTSIEVGVVQQAWEWAIVDHVDLIDMGRSDNDDSATTRHNAMSRTLKHLAKRLNIPVIAVKQLKKRGTAIRKPSPDDLRDSGAYHADADVVLFSDSDDVHHREDPNWRATGMTSIIGSKVREGTGGMRYVQWNGQTQSLVELETRESYVASDPSYDPFQ